MQQVGGNGRPAVPSPTAPGFRAALDPVDAGTSAAAMARYGFAEPSPPRSSTRAESGTRM